MRRSCERCEYSLERIQYFAVPRHPTVFFTCYRTPSCSGNIACCNPVIGPVPFILQETALLLSATVSSHHSRYSVQLPYPILRLDHLLVAWIIGARGHGNLARGGKRSVDAGLVFPHGRSRRRVACEEVSLLRACRAVRVSEKDQRLGG